MRSTGQRAQPRRRPFDGDTNDADPDREDLPEPDLDALEAADEIEPEEVGPPDGIRRPRREAQFEREIEQGLRQPPTKSTTTSWWLGKDRETLTREAEQRSVSMSASKLATKVSGARGIRMFSE